jgi:hypothetical protein
LRRELRMKRSRYIREEQIVRNREIVLSASATEILRARSRG